MDILEKIKNHKNETFLIVFVVSICLAFIFQLKQEDSLDYNRKFGIAKLLRIRKGGKSHKWIEYQFYENGKLIQSSDPLRAGWPNYIREGKPIIRAFYPVEFNREKPEYSKIIITEQPLKLHQIFKNHTTVYGDVVLSSAVSDSYVDLRINYRFKESDFSFRTRLHKDSLPCGNVKNCIDSKIKMMVSNHYPEANDLYYKSYDRKNLLRKYKLN